MSARIVLRAGSGAGGAGSPATAARLIEPFGVETAPDGSLVIAEMGGQRVLRVGPDGVLTRIAGTGEAGFAGDGGPALEARFDNLHNLAISRDGTIYLSDTWNRRVRRIDPDTGVVDTVAGTGEMGPGADGMPAAGVALGGIYCVALDPDQTRLYLTDLDNRAVRALDLRTGILTTVAGNGARGVPDDGTPARTSPLVDPRAAVADGRGNLYILERDGHALRVVDAQGRIRTVAGTGTPGPCADDADARAATLNAPKHLCCDRDGSVVLADTNNHAILRYRPDTGRLTRIAGTGEAGDAGLGGDPRAAQLHYPHGVCIAPSGNLIVADSYNHRVLEIVPDPQEAP